ncbi:MAG: hypothetical protein EBU90_22940 [Proteobacteria bacterium]|nr:hypothetical protein [Pseudomonadota bacterium]NBP15643.1 hypothetical protein [bacterium]
MPLPGLPTLSEILTSATNLCNIKNIWKTGQAFSKTTDKITLQVQVWPGWENTVWYRDYPIPNNIDPCIYEQCVAPSPDSRRIEIKEGNILLPPEIYTCCTSSSCCIKSKDIPSFKSFLQSIVNVINGFLEEEKSNNFLENLRSNFTGSCEAINKAIEIVNSIAGRNVYDITNSVHRCAIKQQLDNLFPASHTFLNSIVSIKKSYESVINGSLPLPGWVVFCDCCNCEVLSQYFSNTLPSSQSIVSTSYCNQPYNNCVDSDCEQGGTGGIQSLPGNNASFPFVNNILNISNWIPCRNSVEENRVPGSLNCQANVTGICGEGTPSLFQGVVGCNLQRQGFYNTSYDSLADITNCCPICNCDDLKPIVGLNISYIGNSDFINNCTGAGSNIITIDVSSYLADNCYVKNLSCILCA